MLISLHAVAQQSVKRRLAAIMAADVVGYSRLIGKDELGTLAALKAQWRELVEPLLDDHGGRIVKTSGDGFLAEFPSIVDAVACGAAIQRGVAQRNKGASPGQEIVLRVGINLGDVIIEGDDIFGDGVNIAARLEATCEPGGLRMSRAAYEQVKATLPLTYNDCGPQDLKNIAEPVHVFELSADSLTRMTSPGGAEVDPLAKEQEIHFCLAGDGVRLAYATLGQGPPLVKTGNWMTHLEYDLKSPVWRGLYTELARDHQLLRYDVRNNGLSDHDVGTVDFDSYVADLAAVVDAAGVNRFDLLGISQGCSVSVAYAVRYPERVNRMVLYGGYAQGANKRAGSEGDRANAQALLTLTRHGWGQDNPAFRQVFTSLFMPDASKAEIDWFNELQRVSASPEDAVRNMLANSEVDITELLPQVKVPTLVMHARGDCRIPFDSGRQLAAGIPGARFIPLDSRNHIILPREPAFARFLGEIKTFLKAH